MDAVVSVGPVLTVDSPTGLDYLTTVTALAQRRRLAHPDGEVWEAADLQWWWPRHPHDDPADARVWWEGTEPVAAVVVTRWRADRFGCDVLADADFGPAWEFAAQRCAHAAETGVPRIEMALPDGASAAHDAARRSGFAASPEVSAVCWLDPADRREPRTGMAAGYRILARADDGTRPHPMIGRNGAGVEDGLRRCSLYDPSLDLAVIAPDGTVAGYALFWPDPMTGVGLVEPVRIEDGHAGRGLGAQLLDAGLRGLTARGCRRLKISVDPGNSAAARLYAGAGFAVRGLDRTWLYSRDPGAGRIGP